MWERGRFSEDTGREIASSTIGTAKAMRVALSLEEGQTEMRSSMYPSVCPKGAGAGLMQRGQAGTGDNGSCRRLGVDGTSMDVGNSVDTFQLRELSKVLATSQTVSEMVEKPDGWPLFPKFMRRLMSPMSSNVKQLATARETETWTCR